MHKLFKKILWALICITIIICISFSVLRHLFPLAHYDIIDKYCKKYNVDENLVLALAKAESNFNEKAASHAGAKGVMQVTDETFDFCKENTELETENIFDIDTNIHAGIWYLSFLSEKYDGNTKNILAAYNAGMGNVDRWLEDKQYSYDGNTLEDIPYEETRHYIEKIDRYETIYSILY